jgi:hypothetical protein
VKKSRLCRVVLPGLAAAACVEGGNLAVSAGAPVSAAVQGRITDCGHPVPGAEVLLLIQQDVSGQARPVDARVGPVVTTRQGSYLIEVSPAFAVPGAATIQLRITAAGVTQELSGGTLELRLGLPARDTTRLDADIGIERRTC